MCRGGCMQGWEGFLMGTELEVVRVLPDFRSQVL